MKTAVLGASVSRPPAETTTTMRTRMPFGLGPLTAIAIAMAGPRTSAQQPGARRVRRSPLRRRIREQVRQGDHGNAGAPAFDSGAVRRREMAQQRLYEITIPNLALETEFVAVRRRLLADFPAVLEVFAMRAPGTLLIAYRGEDEVDAWCAALSDAVAARRRSRATWDSAIAAADHRLEGALEGAR